MRLLVPDAGHLSQVMAQSTGPAFILGAVAGFTSILLGRMTNVLDRIRSLNEIAEDDTARAHLKSDIPRLRQRARLMNGASGPNEWDVHGITPGRGICDRIRGSPA